MKHSQESLEAIARTNPTIRRSLERDRLQRKIQRDIFEDRATITGPMFESKEVSVISLLPNCEFCEAAKPHTAAECGRRIGTNV